MHRAYGSQRDFLHLARGLKSTATKSSEPTVLLSLPILVGNGQSFKLDAGSLGEPMLINDA